MAYFQWKAIVDFREAWPFLEV